MYLFFQQFCRNEKFDLLMAIFSFFDVESSFFELQAQFSHLCLGLDEIYPKPLSLRKSIKNFSRYRDFHLTSLEIKNCRLAD